ncbi:60S ribosomal protein L3 [Apiospora arundinis]
MATAGGALLFSAPLTTNDPRPSSPVTASLDRLKPRAARSVTESRAAGTVVGASSENWDDMHDTGTAAAVAGRIQTAVDDTPGRVQWLTDVAAVVWGRDVKL